MQRMPPCAAFILLIGGAAIAQTRPALEQVGSWVLTCPEAPTAPCQLRDRTPIMQAIGNLPGASLEVMHRGGQFVPVVALRGLSMQAAVSGVLAAQTDIALRFDTQPWIELGCGIDGAAVLCAPNGPAASSAAAALPAANTAVVRIRLSLPGMAPLPEQSRSLDLIRTADALALFRATSPASESMPVVPGLDWHGFLDRAARDMGFKNGLADLLARVVGWMGGRRT
ncbi:MAG TPA: hypothetical protein VL614_22670 [Acetobacteraceae bacterium]|nr:hypothetical protein [Acetobacteraceae bacterium]